MGLQALRLLRHKSNLLTSSDLIDRFKETESGYFLPCMLNDVCFSILTILYFVKISINFSISKHLDTTSNSYVFPAISRQTRNSKNSVPAQKIEFF